MSIITCSHRQEISFCYPQSGRIGQFINSVRWKEGKVLSQLMSANAQAGYKVTVSNKVCVTIKVKSLVINK